MRTGAPKSSTCVRVCCAALLVLSGGVYGMAAPGRPLADVVSVLRPAAPGPTVRRLVADQPRVHVLRAIETDLDRDGDLDIVASTTDAIVQVWINVGDGHFVLRADRSTSSMGAADSVAAPRLAGALAALSPGSKWSMRLDAVRLPVTPSRLCAVGAVLVRARRLDLLPYRPLRAPPVLS